MAKRNSRSGATPLVAKAPREINWPELNPVWLLIPAVLVLAFLAGRWVYSSWPIQSIEVKGQFSLWQPEHIAQQVVWLKQESFFSADLRKVYSTIDELPLLNVVEVKKRWPATAILTVHEDIPMAVWNGEEVLTVAGDILPRPGFVRGDKLARMRGSSHYADEAMRNYRRLHQMLKHRGIQVTELEVTDVGSVSVYLSNGWRVEFGRQYFEERMKRLDWLLKTLNQDQVAAVDLRYGKGAAVKWHQIEEMES